MHPSIFVRGTASTSEAGIFQLTLNPLLINENYIHNCYEIVILSCSVLVSGGFMEYEPGTRWLNATPGIIRLNKSRKLRGFPTKVMAPGKIPVIHGSGSGANTGSMGK